MSLDRPRSSKGVGLQHFHTRRSDNALPLARKSTSNPTHLRDLAFDVRLGLRSVSHGNTATNQYPLTRGYRGARGYYGTRPHHRPSGNNGASTHSHPGADLNHRARTGQAKGHPEHGVAGDGHI